jgi:cytochrome c oxidase subunit 2
LIALLIVVFFMKYRRRPGRNEVGSELGGSLPLELVWSFIPLVIALGMFAWGARVFFDLSRPPAESLEFYAVGKQWMWKFQHPAGNREINDLHVPMGTPVKLTMTSEDVIHSLYIPAFRVKADVLPGRYTTVWFTATKPGAYHIFCAEYCGSEHSLMGGTIYVLDPMEYENWLVTGQTGPPMEISGAELFERLACNTCHQVGDEPLPGGMANRAPSLARIFGTEVTLTNGRTITVDETYIRESILDPQAKVVEGWQPIMPTYRGQVTEEQVNQLVAYLKKLTQDSESAG